MNLEEIGDLIRGIHENCPYAEYKEGILNCTFEDEEYDCRKELK